LGPLVDKFILVESRKTFTYNDKPLYFDNIKHLLPYNHKIIHIILDDLPYDNKCWDNESFQRNSIDRGIQQLELIDSDIILISDVDEIPNPDILKQIRDNKLQINDILCLTQDLYYYNFQSKHSSKWTLAKIMNFKSYKNTINSSPQLCRKSNFKKIDNGGWHLSYFGDANFIINKIQNFSHQEYNKNLFNNIDHINNSINHSKDLFNRNVHIERIDNNVNIPPKFYEIEKEFILKFGSD
jgi:beta-1,4-mannosyl-glycoprotein beta-1,4-N-acetylglucosaminyltransferase